MEAFVPAQATHHDSEGTSATHALHDGNDDVTSNGSVAAHCIPSSLLMGYRAATMPMHDLT